MSLIICIIILILVILLVGWFVLCKKVCKALNNTRDLGSVITFMFDHKYRTLSIVRQSYLKENQGKELNDKKFDKWRKSLDLNRIDTFSYQLHYFMNCIKEHKSQI